MIDENYKLIKTLGKTAYGNPVGVVETKCCPCAFYGGVIIEENIPLDNSTCNFHRTEEEATKWAEKLLKEWSK